MQTEIIVKGARVHNLKNVDVTLPRNKLIVFCGLSGSGKSSLAFDTIYAEGQRRYVESLSAYARQFLNQLDKPEVEAIDGLSPAISIDQKAPSHNPRSTVGTVTEIYDYLRLLFASVGTPHCVACNNPVESQSIQEMADQVMNGSGQVTIMAPIARQKKGEFKKELETVKKEGFTRVFIDGELHRIDEVPAIDKKKKHDVAIVVDRIRLSDENKARLFESIETACRATKGLVLVQSESGDMRLMSEHFACVDCQTSLPEVSPRLFSFNSPMGACATCKGIGDTMEFDLDLVVPDDSLPLRVATQKLINLEDTIYGRKAEALADAFGISLDTPVRELSKEQFEIMFHGPSAAKTKPATRMKLWEGILPNLKRRYLSTHSEVMRFFFRNYMSARPCSSCHGNRLNEAALHVRVGEHNISQLCAKSVVELMAFFEELELTDTQQMITKQVTKEITSRLMFLRDVGLNYLNLARQSGSLSGGEFQRIRLATQIGAGLTGVLYVLDEPSIGLHQKDNHRLIEALVKLRDLGNTLIVVEHDEDTIRVADHVVDIGPAAGRHGGEVLYSGPLNGLEKVTRSQTSDYVFGRKKIEIPKKRRPIKKAETLTVVGANQHNLQGVTVDIPLHVLTCVTGVSGSGKSTLINDTLQKALAKHFNKSRVKVGAHKQIKGIEKLDKMITIDQSPIGRTPRSNPATYTGLFTPIRDLFAQTKDAKMKGYKPGRFSFNVKGGRCEACEGDGVTKIEMHFLSDVYVTCDVCRGKRFNEQTLEVKFKGYSIADVLEMTVNEALEECFENIPAIAKKLKTLQRVGLGYIHLGQRATTLSGGEAQRIKLAKELSKTQTGKTMYILDEPTTGLHFADIQLLLDVLHELADKGNTVVVIEHNLDVIKTADYLIDMGPDGGDGGGQVIAKGTPEAVSQVAGSYTGQFLATLVN